jgi:radical SAM protein with 4Fe4S-binding SPASM domain
MRPRRYSLAVELTAHCNQKCTYCYNAWREDNGAELAGERGERLLSRVARVVEAIAFDHVTITGGEPFSSADVWPLLDLLKARDLEAQIISNGGLIDASVAERLAGYRVRFVQLTLDGPDAELHEAHVGKGHFARTLRGARALVEARVPLVGCVVITRANAASVGAILTRWHDLGARHMALSRFSPAGYATRHAATLLPSRSDLVVAFGQAAAFGRAHPKVVLSATMPVPPCVLEPADYAPVTFGHCPIGTEMQELALGPDGRLRHCTLHEEPIDATDVLEADVAALVASPRLRDYRRRTPEFCRGCLHEQTCGGGCGASAIAMLGDHDQRLPDPIVWQHVDDAFGERLRHEGRRHLEVIA